MDDKIYYYIIGSLILLLFIRRYVSKKTTIDFTKLIMDEFNNSLLTFTSFLDEFNEKYACSKEYLITKSFNMNMLYENYCKHCKSKDKCYGTDKHITYKFLSNALSFGHAINYKNQDQEVISLMKQCTNTNEIVNTSNMINNRSLSNKGDYLLGSQLESISTLMKNYVMDRNKDYAKQSLHVLKVINKINRTNKVIHYNLKSVHKEDLEISLYFKRLSVSKFRKIRKIIQRKLLRNIDIIIETIDGYKKLSITKKLSFKYDSAAITIAKGKESVSGDNYLIKDDKSNAHLIASISDGMGKGYVAYNESKNVLSLVDNLTDSNIKSDSFFNIMNTFYRLKEYNDIYSTLDFAEISKISGKLKFYKLGCTTSYIYKNNGDIITVENKNLPLGINMLIYTNEFYLDDGDILFMFSDGITEFMSENEIKDKIVYLSNQPSQLIINSFLGELNITDNQDDLSIICIKTNRVA